MDTTATAERGHGQLTGLHLTESIADLAALGFSVPPVIGQTALVGESIALGATVAGIEDLDGLALMAPGADSLAPSTGVTAPHANGVVSIDHVVVMTPNPDRTQLAFEAAGLEPRRVRRIGTSKGTRRQTFFWLGDVICEVGGPDDGTSDDPAAWWGLALTVADVDATASFFGDHASPVKDAVQPGRRVCTLRSPRSSTPVLFISPHVKP